MTDRELLELAAKAAGYETWRGRGHQDEMLFMRLKNPDPTGKCSGIGWNPLTDDGDAFRLAVVLGLNVFHAANSCYAMPAESDFSDEKVVRYCDASDAYEATRRAIVRAAASIAQQEQPQ